MLRISCFFIIVFLLPKLLFCQEPLKLANKQWIKAINKKTAFFDLKGFYFDKACLLYPNEDKDIRVYDKFNTSFLGFAEYVNKIKKQKTLHAVKDKDGKILEIGYIKTKSQSNFAYVTAWQNGADGLCKEVHLVYPLAGEFNLPIKNKAHDTNIDQARDLWVELSNSHRPSKLIKLLYTEDALYFNQGKTYKGFLGIDPKYAYMSNKNWDIELFAEHVLQVSESRALEIGYYKSSGKGHYILVWEKDVEGTWKVLFDFNF